jgi:hypothetical protein
VRVLHRGTDCVTSPRTIFPGLHGQARSSTNHDIASCPRWESNSHPTPVSGCQTIRDGATNIGLSRDFALPSCYAVPGSDTNLLTVRFANG